MTLSEPQHIQALKKDAHRAIWAFAVINVFVLIFWMLEGGRNEFVFVMLFVQGALLLLWLLPVFIFQVAYKKQGLRLAMYQSLASYTALMGQVYW